MIKLYYTCPIIAAMMAEYHSVRYTNANGTELEWCHEFNCYHMPDKEELSQSWEGKHYIHPDSMPIFEAKEGDVLRGEDTIFVFVSSTKPVKFTEAKIIQRNDMPFVMPESEEL